MHRNPRIALPLQDKGDASGTFEGAAVGCIQSFTFPLRRDSLLGVIAPRPNRLGKEAEVAGAGSHGTSLVCHERGQIRRGVYDGAEAVGLG